jgi:hypothetical protein
MASHWDSLTAEQRDTLEVGNASMDLLKRNPFIERWRDVGIALNILQETAMAAARTNEPIGLRYNEEWLGLANHVPHLRDIDKSTRSHAMWLATNWDDVSKWLRTVPVNIRLKINHPTTVRRRYDGTHNPPRKEEPRSQRVRDQIIKLQEENDRLRQGVAVANPEELGDMICDIHGPTFVTKLILHLREKIR